MRNFHLPLPDQTYTLLRTEAERTKVPATALAREAIDSWLKDKARKARHDAIAVYAGEMAGTALDVDSDLEAAGIEHLLKTRRKRYEAR
jgi:hypothetical protein